MATFIVKSAENIEGALLLIKGQTKFPFTVKVTEGAPRSLKQNRLYHKWMNELASQGDMTSAEYTALTKLTIGVPLLRSQDIEYKEFYDQYVKGREYSEKLKMMYEPYGFPVSSLMTTKQFKEYLDAIYSKYSQEGFHLTSPEGNEL